MVPNNSNWHWNHYNVGGTIFMNGDRLCGYYFAMQSNYGGVFTDDCDPGGRGTEFLCSSHCYYYSKMDNNVHIYPDYNVTGSCSYLTARAEGMFFWESYHAKWHGRCGSSNYFDPAMGADWGRGPYMFAGSRASTSWGTLDERIRRYGSFYATLRVAHSHASDFGSLQRLGFTSGVC